MRADVIAGLVRPDALGAFAFHGMWRGLQVLFSARETSSSPSHKPSASPVASTGTLDRQLVRLLADMVLATELEVQHAR